MTLPKKFRFVIWDYEEVVYTATLTGAILHVSWELENDYASTDYSIFTAEKYIGNRTWKIVEVLEP